nr:ribonuclease HI [uncultured Holophaga sp.]
MSLRTKVELYCDGSCLGNPGPGGWAFILRVQTPEGVREKEGSGWEPETTNNRMELMGAIKGLESLTRPCDVEIYCDSQYVVKGVQGWIAGWKRNGWRKADKSPVINVELWKTLEALLQRHRVEAHWVKGHAGHAENERVDQLAREAIGEGGKAG